MCVDDAEKVLVVSTDRVCVATVVKGDWSWTATGLPSLHGDREMHPAAASGSEVAELPVIASDMHVGARRTPANPGRLAISFNAGRPVTLDDWATEPRTEHPGSIAQLHIPRMIAEHSNFTGAFSLISHTVLTSHNPIFFLRAL